MQLQQGRMSALEYASKFVELSRFVLAFMADKKLNMNCFEEGHNPNLKERILLCQYISYEDTYSAAFNVEGD